ncbi:TlpA disulfide reductase family protein [Brevundimonas sp.]|uniref:TlpA family protein disulfide reductase n=1 Tax=Brevundimonas sp. TaxID=1871086 RepID=UPI0028AFB24C|nr:TlpA disulfide reductase family protein [Brevundimonas sp.]
MSGSKRTLAGVATAVLLIGAIGGVALLYANREGGGKESASSSLAVYARGSLSKLLTPVPAPAPDYVFKDAEGRDVRFADFKGRVAVVNLWATWCAPCKIEMPTLAALAAHYQGRDDVAVVTISMDVDKAVPEARAFIAEHPPLAYYADPKFQLPFEFPGKGAMPQTILLDREGRVRAVLTGEADWASAEAKALVDALLAEK